jgi:hypothetical protein
MELPRLLLAAAMLVPALGVAEDPRELVRCAASRDEGIVERTSEYVHTQRTIQRRFDGSGNVSEQEVKTHEISHFYGRPYRRLVQIDDQALPPDQERKEAEKLDKELAKRRNESERAREKREDKERRELEERREMLAEMADAFTWRIAGQEVVSGANTWVLDATPIPNYRGKTRGGKMLSNFRGRLWIETGTCLIAKVEAEVLNPISFGWVLFRIRPGTTFNFELAKLDTSTWLPMRSHLRGGGRLALFKNYNVEVETTFSGYRRFQTDSRIVSTGQTVSGQGAAQ